MHNMIAKNNLNRYHQLQRTMNDISSNLETENLSQKEIETLVRSLNMVIDLLNIMEKGGSR